MILNKRKHEVTCPDHKGKHKAQLVYVTLLNCQLLLTVYFFSCLTVVRAADVLPVLHSTDVPENKVSANIEPCFLLSFLH